jgi:hypothetical protein
MVSKGYRVIAFSYHVRMDSSTGANWPPSPQSAALLGRWAIRVVGTRYKVVALLPYVRMDSSTWTSANEPPHLMCCRPQVHLCALFWLLVILLDSGLPHLHLISSLSFLLPKRNPSENENENLHHTISEADEITFSQGHQT